MYMAALNHVSGTDVTVEGEEDGWECQQALHASAGVGHWPDLSPSPNRLQGKLRPQRNSSMALALAAEC